MDYMMKSVSLLSPVSLSKCVSQQLIGGGDPRPRPFRVTNAARSVKKGVMAATVDELRVKVLSLGVSRVRVLVLDEDGTCVDSEDFFQTLPENSVLMVLEEEQHWTPHSPKNSLCKLRQQPVGVAKLTLDFYKPRPEDLIGCLKVEASLYGASLTYDLHCLTAKKMLREALGWSLFSMQTMGRLLLASSYCMEQLLKEEERRAEEGEEPAGSNRGRNLLGRISSW